MEVTCRSEQANHTGQKALLSGVCPRTTQEGNLGISLDFRSHKGHATTQRMPACGGQLSHRSRRTTHQPHVMAPQEVLPTCCWQGPHLF